MNSTYSVKSSEVSHSCGCVGPQNGQPLCPCRMRGVQIVDGRYVQIIDHGPVSKVGTSEWAQDIMARFPAALARLKDK